MLCLSLAAGCAPTLPPVAASAPGSPIPESVEIPSSDPTPPLATLRVSGEDTSLSLATGMDPEALELSPDDSLVLLAQGEDGDGGVKDVSLTGNAQVSCRDPNTGMSNTRTTGFQRHTVAGSLRPKEAPTRKSSRFVLRTRDFAALCPGRAITGLVGQATVSAVNFHGGHAASPRLEFRLAAAKQAAVSERTATAITARKRAKVTDAVPMPKAAPRERTADIPQTAPNTQSPPLSRLPRI